MEKRRQIFGCVSQGRWRDLFYILSIQNHMILNIILVIFQTKKYIVNIFVTS